MTTRLNQRRRVSCCFVYIRIIYLIYCKIPIITPGGYFLGGGFNTLGTRGNTCSNRSIHQCQNKLRSVRPKADREYSLWPQTVAISPPCYIVTCTKMSLLMKPVFQYSVSGRDKRAVKTCLHVS